MSRDDRALVGELGRVLQDLDSHRLPLGITGQANACC
jgi:hypothetical protein